MKLFYDFHIHSCLSPCADDTMTPADIAGIGALNNLQIMALTDHNSCANCPAFFDACSFYGVIPVAGMELTTAEDIHVVCLFRELEKAMMFSDYVYERLQNVKNSPEIFGNQYVTDLEGNKLREIEKLLIGATDITIDEAPGIVSQYGGICYPAHIDRESNGIIAILGDIPPEPDFKCAELHNINLKEDYIKKFRNIKDMTFVSGSDAHRITEISNAECYFDVNIDDTGLAVSAVFKLLSGK